MKRHMRREVTAIFSSSIDLVQFPNRVVVPVEESYGITLVNGQWDNENNEQREADTQSKKWTASSRIHRQELNCPGSTTENFPNLVMLSIRVEHDRSAGSVSSHIAALFTDIYK